MHRRELCFVSAISCLSSVIADTTGVSSAGEECLPNPTADPKYVRVDQRMDQASARTYCQVHFYDLASVHNVQENNAVLLACMSGENALSYLKSLFQQNSVQ